MKNCNTPITPNWMGMCQSVPQGPIVPKRQGGKMPCPLPETSNYLEPEAFAFRMTNGPAAAFTVMIALGLFGAFAQNMAEEKPLKTQMDKMGNQEISKQEKEFVEKWRKVALAEQKKFKIPAEILLARALLKSNAGENEATKKCKNPFGIQCRSKDCPTGHCKTFAENHKVFYVKYKTEWEGWRHYSQILHNKNPELLGKTWQEWANAEEAKIIESF